MTAKELATRLHGREYGSEITREEEALAKESGLVVVFGYSDDNMEFRGAWHEEVDCYNSGTAHVTEKGVFIHECEWDDCPYAEKERSSCKTIEAVWCAPDSPAWTYKTEIPHEDFDIMEDGEVYCRGIVFRAADAEATEPDGWISVKDRLPEEGMLVATIISDDKGNLNLSVLFRKERLWFRMYEKENAVLRGEVSQ